MKAKVLKRFKDKHSGKVYNEGDVIEVTKARFDEILTVAPLVEEIKQKKERKAAK